MFRFSSQPIIPSKFVFGVGNFGVLFNTVPTTGENGPSVLANDGGVSGQHVRVRIDSIDPTVTSLFVYENGSFISQGYGDWTYYDSKDGVENAELSTVTINQFSEDINIFIGTVLPSLQSSLNITNQTPSYSIAISDTLSSLQSTMSIVNGVPVSSVVINETLPSLAVGIQLVNVVPEHSLSIITQLPPLQSVIELSFEDGNTNINISEVLPALQSVMSITNTLPEFNVSVDSNLPSLFSSIVIINGDLVIKTNPKNLITIKSQSRFIQIR